MAVGETPLQVSPAVVSRGRLSWSIGTCPFFGPPRPQSPGTAMISVLQLSLPKPSSWRSCTQTHGAGTGTDKDRVGPRRLSPLPWCSLNIVWQSSKCNWSLTSVCFHPWMFSAFVLSPNEIVSTLELGIIFYFPIILVFPSLKHSGNKRMKFLHLCPHIVAESHFPPSLLPQLL